MLVRRLPDPALEQVIVCSDTSSLIRTIGVPPDGGSSTTAVHVRAREPGCVLFESAINPCCEEVVDEMLTERLFAARELEIAHFNAKA